MKYYRNPPAESIYSLKCNIIQKIHQENFGNGLVVKLWEYSGLVVKLWEYSSLVVKCQALSQVSIPAASVNSGQWTADSAWTQGCAK